MVVILPGICIISGSNHQEAGKKNADNVLYVFVIIQLTEVLTFMYTIKILVSLMQLFEV